MSSITDQATGPIIKSDRTGRTRYTARYKRDFLDAFESSVSVQKSTPYQSAVDRAS